MARARLCKNEAELIALDRALEGPPRPTATNGSAAPKRRFPSAEEMYANAAGVQQWLGKS